MIFQGNNLKEKSLALVFTLGVGLKTWNDSGMLYREVALYNKLCNYFKKIFFFTYDKSVDNKLRNYLDEKIEIILMPGIFFNKNRKIQYIAYIIYSFLMPFIHRKYFLKSDFIKTNQMRGAWSALIAKMFFRKKLIARAGYIWSKFAIQNNDNKLVILIIKLIEKIVYKFANVVISSSKKDKEYVEARNKVTDKSVLIKNYVDTENFRPMNLQKKAASLCFIGRLEAQKNLFELLKSLMNSEYNLSIVGDGSLKDDLVEFAREKKIKAEFPGIVSNERLPQLLNQHEVFILPSVYEGMPKSLLEAMACGLPVIGNDVEGINEVIVNNSNGLLCKEDAASIRKTIDFLIKDSDLKNNLGKNARETIIKDFSLDSVLRKEIEVYEQL